MLRIITGKYKGKLLEVPKGTKPITDRIKTSLFDLVRDFLVPGARVLDLFSGSGNFALEALSRGADFAVMVDSGEKQYQVINTNIANLGVREQTELRKQDVFFYLKQEQRSFDVIMLDPPFPFSTESKFALLQDTLKLIGEEGILIFRFPSSEDYQVPATSPVKEVYRQKYGLSTVSFYRKK